MSFFVLEMAKRKRICEVNLETILLLNGQIEEELKCACYDRAPRVLSFIQSFILKKCQCEQLDVSLLDYFASACGYYCDTLTNRTILDALLSNCIWPIDPVRYLSCKAIELDCVWLFRCLLNKNVRFNHPGPRVFVLALKECTMDQMQHFIPDPCKLFKTILCLTWTSFTSEMFQKYVAFCKTDFEMDVYEKYEQGCNACKWFSLDQLVLNGVKANGFLRALRHFHEINRANTIGTFTQCADQYLPPQICDLVTVFLQRPATCHVC
jgi:hypothetical protein